MVGEIAARHALSEEVIEGVGERTGGVPLFVEEVTRLLLERGEQGGVQADPADLAAVACRAPRPARRGARGGADRRGAWTRLFLRAAARRRRDGGAGAASIAGSARRSRPPVCRGRCRPRPTIASSTR